MSKLPLITAKEFEKLLFLLGFELKRQKGSHAFYRHSDGRYTTLPHHGNQMLTRSLISQILREIKLTQEEFIDLLENI
jgi:predicted RNA binding protein YcfA (HicA-like mRNA interferase family)